MYVLFLMYVKQYLKKHITFVFFLAVMFSLKMIHIFTMDSDANYGKGDPNLILGFFPVHLPAYISPWQPVLEAIFFDIFIIGKCIASTVSGVSIFSAPQLH